MFKDKYHQRVKKDLSQLDRSVINEVKDVHIPTILMIGKRENFYKLLKRRFQ